VVFLAAELLIGLVILEELVQLFATREKLMLQAVGVEQVELVLLWAEMILVCRSLNLLSHVAKLSLKWLLEVWANIDQRKIQKIKLQMLSDFLVVT